ncbi:hypothetical protein WICPIJ_010170 [Wickerhamomyces pijperi]|uniref:Uncharacterized protein n=1 Tax=Wickerhamomyces pijperi TaxID=599730 RepID=A0A9P8PIE4_WICPI|nr:hypothetical protein WICPIJ_010170 [Wickerhamomyces pijperi]
MDVSWPDVNSLAETLIIPLASMSNETSTLGTPLGKAGIPDSLKFPINCPPYVSIPNVKGVTSNSKTSLIAPLSTPPWIAAPKATASSGLMEVFGFFLNSDSTVERIFGIRVIPPTNITSSMSSLSKSESFKARFTGSIVSLIKCRVMASNSSSVSFMEM